MESKERVLEAVRQSWKALEHVGEVWRSDREVVLTAVQQNVHALRFAAEALKGDREIVLAAVQEDGIALQYATEALRGDHKIVLAAVQKYARALRYATEALRADRDVVLTAVQQDEGALRFVADVLLEDPTFATEAKEEFHLLKLIMLSGRSTVVVAGDDEDVEDVLILCRWRLGRADDGTTMDLWHGSGEKVPDDEYRIQYVEDFPGVQPLGEISEYQLLVRR
eukprot:6474444-Amphidinium_carterae.1